jgi:hypothetical protein
MQSWIDETVEPTRHLPVDDLLRIYLGQRSATLEPADDARSRQLDALDLWDRLGDFA